jgi:hypothetical protein
MQNTSQIRNRQQFWDRERWIQPTGQGNPRHLGQAQVEMRHCLLSASLLGAVILSYAINERK